MKTAFHDLQAARNAFDRLELLTGITLSADLFIDVAAPDTALQNLERWLQSTSSPALQLQQVLDDPELGRLLIMLLGASQSIADSLIQNPELASLVFDRDELARIPTVEIIREQGKVLLSDSTSYSHALDRVRFLRQR